MVFRNLEEILCNAIIVGAPPLVFCVIWGCVLDRSGCSSDTLRFGLVLKVS